MRQIDLQDIFAAYGRLRETVRETPFEEVEAPDLGSGNHLFLKCENRQITGSFKIRGALNKISCLSREEKSKGVITASSGNHAQGVAYAANLFHIPAKVIVPTSTPSEKINAARKLGAEVVVAGDNYDLSETIAIDLADRKDMTYVHAFNDPEIMAGQGTVAFEMLISQPEIDTLIVPAGGGGLMTGMAICAKSINPRIKVIGVQSEASPPWYHAMKEGRVVEVEYKDSLAEGLTGRITNEVFKIARQLVDEIVLVEESAIKEAVQWLMRRQQIVEGAGAVGVAALRTGKIEAFGKMGIVLSGGNIDLDRLSSLTDKETN